MGYGLSNIFDECILHCAESLSKNFWIDFAKQLKLTEKKAKPIMTNMKVQKQAQEDEAMKLLEQMLKEDSLKLPDFSITNGMTKIAETIPYENKYKL